jgi:hypothetical protein
MQSSLLYVQLEIPPGMTADEYRFRTPGEPQVIQAARLEAYGTCGLRPLQGAERESNTARHKPRRPPRALRQTDAEEHAEEQHRDGRPRRRAPSLPSWRPGHA